MPEPRKPAAPIVETVTRRRELSAEELEPEKKRPDFWEFQETLRPDEWSENNYHIYLYRVGPDGKADGPYLQKYFGPLDLDVIRKEHGGGKFRAKMKRGPQMYYREDFQIEGPAKAEPAPLPTASAGAEFATFAKEMITALREELRQARGGDAGVEAVRNAIELNKQVFTSGLDTVKSVVAAAAPAHGVGGEDPTRKLLDQFMTAAVTRLLNPSDPIDTFKKMVEAMGSIRGMTGSEPVNVGVELARQLPELGKHLEGVAHEWRLGREAEARAAQAVHGIRAPVAISAPASEPNPAAISIEWIEMKIAEIVADQSLTPEDAADEALTFLSRVDPALVERLVSFGETGMLELFRTRPALAQVPADARLGGFIKKFLEFAAPPQETPETPEQKKPN